MILVTLGTQDKSFKRLLNAVQKCIDDKVINEEVVVQTGCTKYNSKDMKIFDLMSQEQLDKYRKQARIIITHAGVGSILDSLRLDKKIIAAARLKKYHEHTNDHQLQILNNFANDGYIIKLENFDDLSFILNNIDSFNPKKYDGNNEKIKNMIVEFIESI